MKETPENYIAAKIREFSKEFRYGVERPMPGSKELTHNNVRDFLRSALQGLLSELQEKAKELESKCANHTLDESYCFDCAKIITDEKTHAWQYGAGISDIIDLLSHYQQSTKDEPQ